MSNVPRKLLVGHDEHMVGMTIAGFLCVLRANRLLPTWVFVIVAIASTPSWVWGAAQKTSTVITSNTMTASSQTNQAIFRENVKMIQNDLIVHSDLMIVHFKEQGENGDASRPMASPEESNKEIRLIEARSHVRIIKGESRARCQYAVYNKKTETIVLQGAPVVWQAGTQVSGQKITMFLKENRSVVEGGTRVLIEEEEK